MSNRISDYRPEPETVELLPDKDSGNWRLSFTDRDTGDEISIELDDAVVSRLEDFTNK